MEKLPSVVPRIHDQTGPKPEFRQTIRGEWYQSKAIICSVWNLHQPCDNRDVPPQKPRASPHPGIISRISNVDIMVSYIPPPTPGAVAKMILPSDEEECTSNQF